MHPKILLLIVAVAFAPLLNAFIGPASQEVRRELLNWLRPL